MRRHVILRVAAKALIPLIMLFALYVQFHGDYGPGGGFQAGVIMASAFVLYALIFGLTEARRVAPPAVVRVLVSAGVLLYAGVGFWCILEGGTFLDYAALAHDPEHPQHGYHLGINVIEFGVGTTVAAVMICMFDAFASRPRLARPGEAPPDGVR